MSAVGRAIVLSAVLFAACESTLSGTRERPDAGIACCFELRCAPGQECFECTCRESECCARLTCLEDLQVCVACACVSEDDPGDPLGSGPDDDRDGYGTELDCDDTDDFVHPDALERCNQIDDDCDASTDEDTCPGEVCCADGCQACCEDADCDDDEGCTEDLCVDASCVNVRPEACTHCCVELCERVQPLDCTDVMRGDCGDSCAALDAVQEDAGCTDERLEFEGCLSACHDPCAGGCDGAGENLGRCLLEYCLDHLNDGDCQTLADAFGL